MICFDKHNFNSRDAPAYQNNMINLLSEPKPGEDDDIQHIALVEE